MVFVKKFFKKWRKSARVARAKRQQMAWRVRHARRQRAATQQAAWRKRWINPSSAKRKYKRPTIWRLGGRRTHLKFY